MDIVWLLYDCETVVGAYATQDLAEAARLHRLGPEPTDREARAWTIHWIKVET